MSMRGKGSRVNEITDPILMFRKAQAPPKSGSPEICWVQPLAATMLALKSAARVFMPLSAIPTVPATVMTPMSVAVPVGERTPVAACPHPMVITPSPITTDPT